MPEKKHTRTNLSKKNPFEVFKRDSFTCQYCGRKAPDVILQCDHIEPVSKGGSDDILNLVTACFDCNSGKSNRSLSDNSVIEKRHRQLTQLQERKEQIQMMFEWQKNLLNLDANIIHRLADFWNELTPGYALNEDGLRQLRNLYRQFTVDEILEAMRIAAEKYLIYDADITPKGTIAIALRKVGGICYTRRKEQLTPERL